MPRAGAVVLTCRRPARAQNVYALPTRQEIATLKESANLFRSNIFRMQVDATLAETRLGASTQVRGGRAAPRRLRLAA